MSDPQIKKLLWIYTDLMKELFMLPFARTSRIILIIVLLTAYGCKTEVYPDAQMEIDPAFREVFNAVIQKDSFMFCNAAGETKMFAIAQTDSVVLNSKGWFINGEPHKLVRTHFHGMDNDTAASVCAENGVWVNKEPATDKNSIGIMFCGFEYQADTLPALHTDSLTLLGRTFTGYYHWQTSLSQKTPGNVKELYLTKDAGFVAFTDASGATWVACELSR
jgi:hypothetical protein